LLKPEQYSDAGFVLYWVKTLQILNFGLISGYVVVFYRNNKQISAKNYSRVELEDSISFILISLVMLTFSISSIFFGLFFDECFFWSGLIFLSLIIFYALEPIARVRNKLYVSLIPDLFVYISMISVLTITYLVIGSSYKDIKSSLFMSYVFLFVFLLSLLTCFNSNIIRSLFGYIKQIKIRTLLSSGTQLFKLGFPVYLASVLYVLLIGVDRIALKLSNSNELAVYLLASQIAVGAMLPLTSLNFVATVDLGEKYREGLINNKLLLKRLFRSIFIYVIFVSIATIISYLTSHFLNDAFKNLWFFVLSLTLGYGAFSVAGTISPLFALCGKARLPAIVLFFLLLITIFQNALYIYYGFDAFYLVGLTSLWLVIYSIFSIFYVHKIIKLNIYQNTI